jgi:hypothetical protein
VYAWNFLQQATGAREDMLLPGLARGIHLKQASGFNRHAIVSYDASWMPIKSINIKKFVG